MLEKIEKKLRKRRSIKIVDDRYSDAQRNEKINLLQILIDLIVTT